jgi:hypothetical protein
MDTLGTILANAAAMIIGLAMLAIFIKAWPLIFLYCLMFMACLIGSAVIFMGVHVLLLDTAIHDPVMHAGGMLCLAASVIGAGVLTVRMIV